MQAKGEFDLLKQDLIVAQEKPGQPVKRGTMAHDHHLYMILTDTAAQQRDEEDLRCYTPRLEELAVRDDHQLYQGIAHRAWGIAHHLAHEYANAVDRLNQAMGIFRRLDTRWQIGRTLLELGRVDIDRQEKDSARVHFSQALESFEAMKAVGDMERTKTVLDSL